MIQIANLGKKFRTISFQLYGKLSLKHMAVFPLFGFADLRCNISIQWQILIQRQCKHTPVLNSCLSFEAGELLLFMHKQESLQQIEEKPERSATLSSTEKKQKS